MEFESASFRTRLLLWGLHEHEKDCNSGFTASMNASTFMYYSPNYLRINEQILLPPIFCLLMFLKFKVAARRMLWANNGKSTILLGYIDAVVLCYNPILVQRCQMS